jgi:DNA repair protein RadC
MNCMQEPTAPYGNWTDGERAVLMQAMTLLSTRFRRGPYVGSSNEMKDYLRCRIAGLEFETVGAIWLTSHMHVLEIEELFRGTLSQSPVYPREIARRALQLNAGGLVLYHNHPSNTTAEPSLADQRVTGSCKSALALIDVQLVDHVVVCASQVVSMAERGLV